MLFMKPIELWSFVIRYFSHSSTTIKKNIEVNCHDNDKNVAVKYLEPSRDAPGRAEPRSLESKCV